MRVGVILVLVVAATTGIVLGSLFGNLAAGDTLWPFAWIFWAPVGGLILLKRHGNGVGRTLLLIGATWGASFALLAGAESSLPIQARVWFDVANVLLGVLPWLGIIWLLLVFPSGQLRGRLERVVAASLGVFGFLALAAFAATPEPMESTLQPSPLAVPVLADAAALFTSEQGFLVIIALAVGGLVALVRRWRASSGMERHQFRWLFLGALLFTFVLTAGQNLADDNPFLYLWLLSGAAIPGAIGIAILRYRLYDIDRIISRTISYALVVGLLIAGVAGVATLAGAQFQEPWVVAATTLGVAALFNPLRGRIQTGVDDRFNRSRYDTEQVMDKFAGTLRDRVDPDVVLDGWVAVVSDTMQPSLLRIWVRE